MIEKVNPSHPDKIADHIAGAIVDLAYRLQDDPKIWSARIVTGKQIGRASCRERVLRLV